MKGGLLDYITNHAHFSQFRYRQLLSQLSSRLARVGPRWRDDEVSGCFRQAAAQSAETVSTAKTNKFMKWMLWNSESLQLRHSNKNTTPPLSEFTRESLLWLEMWMRTGRAAGKQKQRLHKRDQTAVSSSSDEHTATGETDYLCVIQLGIIHVRCDLSKDKTLFPVLPSPAVMVQRRPQQWSRRGMLLHSWSHSSLSLSLSLYSLCPISLAHCLPPSPATAMAALFCSPSLDSSSYPPYNLSPLLSPPFPLVTAPQQSNAAPSASTALLSRSHTSQVRRQDETEFGNFVVFVIKASCTRRFFPLAGFPSNYKSTKAVSCTTAAGWMSNHCEEQQNKLNDFSKFLHAVQNTLLLLVKHHGFSASKYYQ